jgi:ABC-type glycerol-3-phosphate transport system substrate-binding protein
MAVLGPDGRFPDGSSPYEGETDEEIRASMRAGRFKGGMKAVRVGGPAYFTGSKGGDDRLQDFLGSIGALGGMAKEDYEARKAKEKK